MGVWEPLKCCCCTRRTGSLVIGVLFLISGCLNILSAIRSLINLRGAEIKQLCDEIKDFPDCESIMHKVLISGPVCALIIAAIQITFSSLLIHGILKQKTRFMIPMMVMYLVQIILILILSLIIVGVFMYLQIWLIVIFLVVLFSGIIFLETYFLLVIRAYYFDMKRTKGQIHMSLNDQGGFTAPQVETPPPYSDVKPAYSDVKPAYSDVNTPYSDVKPAYSDVGPPPANYYPDLKAAQNY